MKQSSALPAGSNASIFQQIGGTPAVEATVEAFYVRVLADPLLKPFFVKTNLAWLKNSQVRFFTTALGGPQIYKGADMKSAHKKLPIEEKHFGRVAQHLSDTLKALKVPPGLVAQIMQTAGSLAPDIINTPTNSTPLTTKNKNKSNIINMKATLAKQSNPAPQPELATDGTDQELLNLRGTNDAINKVQAVIEFNLDGTIITANANFLTTLGYSLDEIKGKHHSLFVEPAFRDSSEYRNFWRDLNDGKFQAAEFKRIGKGGKEVWIQASYNPIFDADGKPFKVVKFATDVTALVQERVVSARAAALVESSPNPTMFADVNFKIQYMNPASAKVLKTLEKFLPVTVEKMLGQSVDIFHKNPSYQRGILSDPKSLPRSAFIQVGPETLELTITPIYGYKQNHVGAMLTWFVVTEKLAAEKREKELADSLKATMAAVAQTAQTLSSASEELAANSQQMVSNAEETATQAGVVSAAAEQVSMNVQTVATGTEEMTASIKEISKNAQDAAKVAATAVKSAETTTATVSKLGESSAEIGKVIKVITSIAQQTNLLALNATIEAARAGEAGKGFAVVANEVKELAKETAKATEDISQKIEAIQADTKSAVAAIAEISAVINKINDYQNTIASAVEEQTATTNEIGRNVSEAAKGSSEIAANITGVATAAKSTTAGAADTQKAAGELSRMASELQKIVAEAKI